MEGTVQTSVPFPFIVPPHLHPRHTDTLTQPPGISAALLLAALGSAASVWWAGQLGRQRSPLSLSSGALLLGPPPRIQPQDTLSCHPAPLGFPVRGRGECADKQLYPEYWITSLVLLIRSLRLREPKELCGERLSHVRAARWGWAVGGSGWPQVSVVTRPIRSEMSGPEHTASTLPFHSWKQRPQSPDACPRPHSDSASESAGKPGVPNTQDVQALGPRRKACRSGAGHRLAPPLGRGDASRSNSGTSGPPHKGRGFRAGRDLTGC